MPCRLRLLPTVVVAVLQLQLFLWRNAGVVSSFSSPAALSSRSSTLSLTPAAAAAATTRMPTRFVASSPTNSENSEEDFLLGQSVILDNYTVPASHPLHSLLSATSAACSFEDAIARTSAASSNKRDTDDDDANITRSSSITGMAPSGVFGSSGEVNAHESFRYEWGTWISAEKLLDISNALGEMRMIYGGLDSWLSSSMTSSMHHEEGDDKEKGRRIRIAGGKYWDIILHDLPRGA